MILTYKSEASSLAGNAKVFDENNEVVFVIKGKLISFTKKAKIYDPQQNLLFVVRNKFFRLFLRSALVYSNGRKLAKVTKKISIKDNYHISGFQQEIHIDGSIVGSHYRIICDGKCIAEIDSASTVFEKTLNVPNPEDAGLVVAIQRAIQNIWSQK